jgi:hypothetical protein
MPAPPATINAPFVEPVETVVVVMFTIPPLIKSTPVLEEVLLPVDLTSIW